MRPHRSSLLALRLLRAALAAGALVVALPGLLLGVAVARFGHLSPLDGMNAPWRWSMNDVRSWARQLTNGLDSSAQLVDLFFRVALLVGWSCLLLLLYTVVDEVVFHVRHGMPSAHHRHLVGIGSLGRELAAVLIAALPLVAGGTPTLAARTPLRPPATAVADRVVADRPPEPRQVAPAESAPVTADAAGGWSPVEVRRGDSVWAIAQRVAGGADVAAIARQIVAANLGTVMNDGHRFTTPALIEPGWVLNVPAPARAPVVVMADPIAPDARAHVVVPGDSYWKIAEEHVPESATPREIAEYTEQLIEVNAPMLGHSDERLIWPGDVVHLGADTVAGVPDPTVELPAVVPNVVASPVVEPVPVAVPSPAPEVPPASSLPPPTTPVAPSTVAPPPTAHVTLDSLTTDDGVPVKRGLGAAMLLGAGALVALDARRRRQLRGAQVGASFPPPSPESIRTERVLRTLTPADRLARLDLALRSAAADVARQQCRIVAAEIADDGEIRVYTDRPAFDVAVRWVLDPEGGAWRLPASVALADLAAGARSTEQPCPAIVHLGESAGGQLFVDLEAIGVLSVEAAPSIAASIVRCAAASLAVSPFVESARIFTVGLEAGNQLGSSGVERHASLADGVSAVRETVGSIPVATSGSATTFALRANGRGGEAWEPSLLLAIGGSDVDDTALVTLAAGGGRGVGVMIDRPVAGGGAVLRATGDDFVLEPLGRRLTPVTVSAEDIAAVDELLVACSTPIVATVADRIVPLTTLPAGEFVERQHELVVRVLGQVGVHARGMTPVTFDRSKALELVVWLSQHRQRPTRTSARTALWELAVQDATFSNVVSDARRAMARAVAPPPGHEWIGRTMNEDLPLHDLVVSDAELLADRLAAARGLPDALAIAVLRPGVEMIEGMPFAGTSYLWPDAEGITSSLVLLATSAAAELAARYLSIGDVDGVFWATGHGLQVLAGHEELIALRMHAHAERGDLAGVRAEWESYERAVQADTWSAAEPSPKLVALRRRLLAPSLAS